MTRARLDARRGLLEIEKGSAARGARDELGPGSAPASPLKDPVGEIYTTPGVTDADQGNGVPDAVAEQRTQIDGCDHQGLGVVDFPSPVAQHDRNIRGPGGAQARRSDTRPANRRRGVDGHQDLFETRSGTGGEGTIDQSGDFELATPELPLHRGSGPRRALRRGSEFIIGNQDAHGNDQT